MNWRNQGVKAEMLWVCPLLQKCLINRARIKAYTKMTYVDTKGHWKREKSNAEMMSHCLLHDFCFGCKLR